MASSNSNVRCINYYDLCRICTDSSDQNTNVFSAEGRAKNLSSKIYECLSLQIDEKDRLPKVVCGQCVQQVEQMHALRHTCKKTQTMLNDCLNIPPMQNQSEKLFIKDAIDDTGKSLSVVASSTLSSNPANSSSSQSNNLLSSIMQAVGMQSQQQFTITVDNSNISQQQQPQQQKQTPPSPIQQKSDRQTVLEEFIRLKPDIKITPLGKRDHSSAPLAAVPSKPQETTAQPPTLQAQTMRTMAAPQLQLQPMLNEQSIWQQIQQLQQLTSQLAATTQFSATEDGTSLSENKKPKLNFVLSAPAGPQFTGAQFVGTQPQLQLQLMPVGGAPTAAGGQTQLNATALISSLSSPQTGTSGGAGNILSPNKCFLPITIRDENSDQQIVAHIDTKNLVLPTTYQVQMKLQPQLATADGQPIMELTPTSIPATLQLTPQNLGATTAVASTGQFQNIFLAPQPPTQQQLQQQQPQHNIQQQQHPQHSANTATVTSQQIIRSPQSNCTTPQLLIRNVPAISTMPKTVKDEPTFKIPAPRQRQMQPQSQPQQQLQQPQPVNPKVNTSPTSSPVSQQPPPVLRNPEPRRVVAQGKPVQPVDNIPPTSTASNPAALQRLSSSTTITKVAKPQPVPAPPNMPLLNKQNITISRIPTHTVTQTTLPKPSIPAPTPVPAPAVAMPKPAPAPPPTQPPSIAVQHKKIIMESPEKKAPKPKIPRPPQPICPAPGKSPEASIPGLTCPKCNREFKKREHLVQHIKLHAGLRPYKCTEEGCDKAFSRKEHLSRHLISHSGKKLFTCEVCKKPFSRKDNLSKHMRIHTHPPNETLFCCDVCNKNFATKLHYEKHREMHKKSVAAPASTVNSSPQGQTKGQAPAKDVAFEIKQQTSQQQKQSPIQPQQAQIMHVVTTQDHAGNTITITQAPDSNMSSSLANYVQLGFPNFPNSPANQIVCKK